LALSNTSTYLSGRDLAAAMAAGQEAAECGEQCGDMYLAGNALDNLDQSRYVAGRWDDIETDPVGPLDEIRAANPADAASHLWPRVLVAHARSEAFDTERILTALAGVDPAQDETELGIQTRLLPCLVAMLSGDYLAAASAARGSAELAWRLLGPDVALLDPWILAVDLSVEGGDFAQARQLVAIVAAADSYRVIGVMRAELLRLRGTVEAVDPASAADPPCVEQDLLDAIAALDAFGAVPDRARAQATLGAWLTQQGRANEAAPHLDAARATFNELRATRWLRTLDYTTKNAAVGVSDMAVG
jgi:hypothetical protein